MTALEKKWATAVTGLCAAGVCLTAVLALANEVGGVLTEAARIGVRCSMMAAATLIGGCGVFLGGWHAGRMFERDREEHAVDDAGGVVNISGGL